MKSFWYDILANLTSDVLFITVLFVFAWLLYFFTKRQKLYKFFCIADTKRLNVYLSRLDIQHGGALATNGTPGSYVGVTIVYNESMVANRFRDNFNYLSPSLSDKPGLLGKILFSDVTVRSIISVTSQNQIDTSTSFITLGGPTYNFVSDFIQNHAQSHVKFPPSGTSINISGLSPMTNLTYGFIQRIYDT